jgi:hypothetical protein
MKAVCSYVPLLWLWLARFPHTSPCNWHVFFHCINSHPPSRWRQYVPLKHGVKTTKTAIIITHCCCSESCYCRHSAGPSLCTLLPAGIRGQAVLFSITDCSVVKFFITRHVCQTWDDVNTFSDAEILMFVLMVLYRPGAGPVQEIRS